MVTKHMKETQYCLSVKLSLVGLMGLIRSSVPSGAEPGLYDTRSKSQIKMIVTADTGIATANHSSQSTGGSMYESVIRFCGDEIGELCPPILAARAMASCMRLLEKTSKFVKNSQSSKGQRTSPEATFEV